MTSLPLQKRPIPTPRLHRLGASVLLSFLVAGCAPTTPEPSSADGVAAFRGPDAPYPDPRPDLRGGLFDAEQAVWNLRVLANAPPPDEFIGDWSSDLAFRDNLVFQGNYRGFSIWDVADPSQPQLVTVRVCPGSQGDVSVYGDLLFVSVEGMDSRLDCGTQGVAEAVSRERMRGIRVFDITDVRNPRLVANVQTCRGSHTHTVIENPGDRANVYIYNSGTGAVRAAAELAGCSGVPAEDPTSSLARIDVVRVPLANPEQAAIVNSPRVLEGLAAPPRHGPAPEDLAAIEAARARGAFVVRVPLRNEDMVLPPAMVESLLAEEVAMRGGSGPAMAADSAALRARLPELADGLFGGRERAARCHDITVYSEVGLAAGACIGYGVLMDIRDPLQPRRLDAVADSNFVAWHSATFSNDGTKLLFTDEWGGGSSPKCRPTDPAEWGANAIYSIEDGRLRFRSYYKLPAPQSHLESCVAHNGSLIPIPDRDVMVQAWIQGGVSVFDWTDPERPYEIAYFDRGPADPNELVTAGVWSTYWHNGLIISSEFLRGLDVMELVPSRHLSQNEIEAAKTVRMTETNAQDQRRIVWPASFALARAYADQLERSSGLAPRRLTAVRSALDQAEQAPAADRRQALDRLAADLDAAANGAGDRRKTGMLADVVRELARGD